MEELLKERVREEVKRISADYERELLMKQTSLRTLQSQINPHFLYNALECIRGRALLDGSKKVAEIAQTLSYFFRYSISGKSDLVTLKEELDNVKSYVAIQQFRFGERFSCEIKLEAEEEVLTETILPKLTLQPIVENSIVHGFSQITSGGMLKILIRRLGQHISITVSDNGEGMEEERLERFKEHLLGREDVEDGGPHTGIGMPNVNRRLKLFFGEEYGIAVDSCVGVGTSVELFFPYRLSL